MKKIQKHIEIVRSTTRGLSSLSLVSCNAIYSLLSRHYTTVGVTNINNISDLKLLVTKQPDLVFMGMKYIPANPSKNTKDPVKIWIADFLDDNGIAYSGSNQMAHELELNKPLAKQRALDEGLSTSPFYVVTQNELNINSDIPINFPVFIKPTNRGGGVGIDGNSVAYNFSDLQTKVDSITDTLNSDSLIEEYLPGREFSVAILKNEYSDEFSVMPLELIAPPDNNGVRILSAKVKHSDTESFMKITDKLLKDQVSTLALKMFMALGAQDYGRIDIRLDKYGVPHFLEANLIPSLIEGYGNFPKACKLNIGMSYEPMILSIVKLGLLRAKDISEQQERPALTELFGTIPVVQNF